jgi:hypothetical protein
VEHLDALVTCSNSEGMFDTERDLLLVPLQVQHFAELNPAQIFCLIPEVRFLSVELGLRPGKIERVLVGMVRGEVAGDLLPGGGVNRMNVSGSAVMSFDARGDRLLLLDVFQHGLATQRDAEHIIGFREHEVAAENGLDDSAERTGCQEGVEFEGAHLNDVRSSGPSLPPGPQQGHGRRARPASLSHSGQDGRGRSCLMVTCRPAAGFPTI